MAVKNFVKDSTVGTEEQPAATVTGMVAGDITNVIQVPLGLSALRVYASSAGTFTLEVKSCPINNVAGMVVIATLTQAAPSALVPGPIGSILRLDTPAASGTVNAGVMGLKG